ncbi:MAG: 50S ribosomal protein L21 [Coriobacteriales bacterium]|jgi:large subunit ribosomal protein L21|nr:50S ribosomal protein L21 [Coriobacteriales bacterium]
MYAIVATGGKQYKVESGDVIEVELLSAAPGDTVALDVVLLVDGSKVTTDASALVTAKVFAEVIEHFKGEKALIFKFKKRKGYKRLRGHRQPLTRLEIVAISPTGEAPKPEKKAAAKKKEKAVDKEEAAPEAKVAAEAEDSDAKPKRTRKKAEKPLEDDADKLAAADEPAGDTADPAADEPADDTAEPAAADEPAEPAADEPVGSTATDEPTADEPDSKDQ